MIIMRNKTMSRKCITVIYILQWCTKTVKVAYPTAFSLVHLCFLWICFPAKAQESKTTSKCTWVKCMVLHTVFTFRAVLVLLFLPRAFFHALITNHIYKCLVVSKTYNTGHLFKMKWLMHAFADTDLHGVAMEMLHYGDGLVHTNSNDPQRSQSANQRWLVTSLSFSQSHRTLVLEVKPASTDSADYRGATQIRSFKQIKSKWDQLWQITKRHSNSS